MKPYVPLWCKSHFSLLEGASAPEELVTRAHELGLQALALTDRDSLAGAPRAAAHARKLGLKLLYGAEVHLTAQRRITLIAKDRLGYGNLTQLLSRAPSQEASSALTMDDSVPGCAGLFCAHRWDRWLVWRRARGLLAHGRSTQGVVCGPPLCPDQRSPLPRRGAAAPTACGARPGVSTAPGRRQRTPLPPPEQAPALRYPELHPVQLDAR